MTPGPMYYRHPQFFGPEACRRIRAAMDAGGAEQAEVLGATSIARRRQVRHATHVEVDAATLDVVERQLDAEGAAIARFFRVPLSGREGTGFLRYGRGGFYRPHRDRGALASWPAAADRRITVVVFLNSAREAAPDGEFGGGCLRLLPDEGKPLDIHPVQGTLVAFPAMMRHEVAMVRQGTRDTLVDWFY